MPKRRSKAILAGPRAEAIGAGQDGPERLRKLKEAAAAEVPTSETWINVDHAIAITPVPTEEADLKLKVKSVTIKPKG